MIIEYDKRFKKHFCKRIPEHSALDKKYQERLAMFRDNPSNPILKNHKLTSSKQDKWAFSVTGDYRVVYFWKNEKTATLVDVGTHNQVYGK